MARKDRMSGNEAVSYLGEDVHVFLFFFYFLFVEDFRKCVKRVCCVVADFFVCLFFCGGDDAVCYGCIGYASCFPFHGDGRYIAQS